MGIGDLIIETNHQFIALNKPPSIPVQGDRSGDKSLLDLAEIYCKQALYVVHRIDRPSSGIVLFAKTKNTLVSLNQQFKDRDVQKTYLALTAERPPSEQDTLTHFLLKKQELNRSKAFKKKVAYSKKAELYYKVIGQSKKYFLLEIDLFTGRHHQIRAQLGAIGCPIRGDVKYGFKRANPDRSIDLHAWKLAFQHPVSGKLVELKGDPPSTKLWQSIPISDQ